jgi:hypothetical protein
VNAPAAGGAEAQDFRGFIKRALLTAYRFRLISLETLDRIFDRLPWLGRA